MKSARSARGELIDFDMFSKETRVTTIYIGVPLMAKKVTKADKVRQFIKDSGTHGRSFTEMQRFVVEMNGRNYDEMQTDYYGNRVRRNRGYWCVHFQKILVNPFVKNEAGRWMFQP